MLKSIRMFKHKQSSEISFCLLVYHIKKTNRLTYIVILQRPIYNVIRYTTIITFIVKETVILIRYRLSSY